MSGLSNRVCNPLNSYDMIEIVVKVSFGEGRPQQVAFNGFDSFKILVSLIPTTSVPTSSTQIGYGFAISKSSSGTLLYLKDLSRQHSIRVYAVLGYKWKT